MYKRAIDLMEADSATSWSRSIPSGECFGFNECRDRVWRDWSSRAASTSCATRCSTNMKSSHEQCSRELQELLDDLVGTGPDRDRHVDREPLAARPASDKHPQRFNIERELSSKEVAMTKKAWRKPEVKAIAAGSAESSTTSGSDGAAMAPKKS